MKLRALVEVTKPKQTFLLMVTFVVAYIVARGDLSKFPLPFFATLLAVSGTTAVNMWLDRDIDALMPRTQRRPLPSGDLKPAECAAFGLFLVAASLILASFVNLQLVAVLFAGFFFDIIIYTVLLKRRSPYSIIMGGVAGAMPCLAGWVAASSISAAAVLMATIVFLWIPSHIWYISMYYEDDYRRAGIPMYPLVVGMERASWAIVLSTAAMLIAAAAIYIVLPIHVFCAIVSIGVTAAFLYKAISFAFNPSRERAKRMYKLASMTLGVIYLSLLIGTFL